MLTAAAARLLVATPAGAAVEVVVCAPIAAGDGLALDGIEVAVVRLDPLGLDAVLGDALTAPLPEAVTWAEPPDETADAETWTNSTAAPTAAMDAARTRVLRRDAVMSGTPSGRLLGT